MGIAAPAAHAERQVSVHALEFRGFGLEFVHALQLADGHAPVLRSPDDGLVTFIDRIKERIRRRGEAISASETEAALGTLPGVAEITACAVASGLTGGEDEVCIAVVLHPGTQLAPEIIAAHAAKFLPRFAQPRFIEIVEELPMKLRTRLSPSDGTTKAGRGFSASRGIEYVFSKRIAAPILVSILRSRTMSLTGRRSS